MVFPVAGQVELVREEVEAPGPGQVLCASERSLISIGTELQCLRGVFDPGTNWERWVRYPFRPGYCMAARVLEVGAEVQNFKSGQLVACRQPHGQYFLADADQLIALPQGISAEQAVWVPISLTAQQGIRRAALELGETVAVVGLGMIGQLVVQYLRLQGARRIIGIDPLKNRLELAEDSGLTDSLNIDIREAAEGLREITGGSMPDVLFEVTGHPEVLAHTTSLVRTLGRIVLLGDTATPLQQTLGPGVVSNSVSILGVHVTTSPATASVFARWSYEAMTRLFFDYLLDGRMHVGKLISHVLPFSEAPRIYQSLREDRSKYMGVLFDWAEDR
ncbi:MAG TPA: zinc-binding alcohol dehydrogenase [Spirochaetia bacterium]|nr:zinc-binding alcohol dehydrogenase [Spirochaetia bacterium]